MKNSTHLFWLHEAPAVSVGEHLECTEVTSWGVMPLEYGHSLIIKEQEQSSLSSSRLMSSDQSEPETLVGIMESASIRLKRTGPTIPV